MDDLSFSLFCFSLVFVLVCRCLIRKESSNTLSESPVRKKVSCGTLERWPSFGRLERSSFATAEMSDLVCKYSAVMDSLSNGYRSGLCTFLIMFIIIISQYYRRFSLNFLFVCKMEFVDSRRWKCVIID